MVKEMVPDFEFRNDAGILVQLVHDGWQQVNVLVSKKDSVRGGHYHKLVHEIFYVVKGKLKLKLSRDEEKKVIEYAEGSMFEIEPYVVHSFEFLEDCIMVAMYDVPVEMADGNKDIYKGGE